MIKIDDLRQIAHLCKVWVVKVEEMVYETRIYVIMLPVDSQLKVRRLDAPASRWGVLIEDSMLMFT